MKTIIILFASLLLLSCSATYNYETEKSEIEKNKEVLLKKQQEDAKPFDYYEYYRWGRPDELKK